MFVYDFILPHVDTENENNGDDVQNWSGFCALRFSWLHCYHQIT